MDVLSDVLAVMRSGKPRSAVVTWRAPWAQEFAAVPGAVGFHLVVEGTCVLLPGGAEPVTLGPGDLVLRAHGDGHVLADTLATRPFAPACRPDRVPLPRHAAATAPGHSDGIVAVLLCGAYEVDPDLVHPLLLDLPDVIHIPASSAHSAQLRSTAELLTAELRQPKPGTEALVPGLLDTLLVYVLRSVLDRAAERATGWAAALHDPGIAAALRAVHTEPARAWTVAGLADEARMSRATFARRFAGLVGQPPLSYLTWWRMTTAATLLRAGDTALDVVAAGVGYTSTFAFGTAFKRRFGMAPGRYRRAGSATATTGPIGRLDPRILGVAPAMSEEVAPVV